MDFFEEIGKGLEDSFDSIINGFSSGCLDCVKTLGNEYKKMGDSIAKKIFSKKNEKPKTDYEKLKLEKEIRQLRYQLEKIKDDAKYEMKKKQKEGEQRIKDGTGNMNGKYKPWGIW